MKTKIVIGMMLLLVALSMGCLEEEKQIYMQESIEELEVIEHPKAEVNAISINQVYGIIYVSYSIENTGNIPITYIEMDILLYNNNKIVAVIDIKAINEKCGDSILYPGQILYEDYSFRRDVEYDSVTINIQEIKG